jgi:hypothetical protein
MKFCLVPLLIILIFESLDACATHGFDHTLKISYPIEACHVFSLAILHNTYQCYYHPPTQKLYLSRHDTFHESLFPFLLNLYASSTSSILNSNSNTNKHLLAHHPLVIQHLNHPIIPPPSPQNSNSSLTPLISPTPHTPTFSPQTFQVPTNSSTRSFTGAASSTPHPSPESTRIVTRSMNQIHKPNPKYLHTSKHPLASSIEPTCVSQALKSSEWRNAMSKEFDALIQQGTWELVPQPQATNLIGCKWVYRIKRKPNGDIDRYKARLVAKGFHQRPGLDYTETFSPVVKPTTIRLVLSLALQYNWPLRQLDVNNAFLHGSLSEEVYMQQPPGFIHPEKPHHVCRLRKSIYGLKQAPRAWFQTLRKFLCDYGFVNSKSDSSLFIFRIAGTVLYTLVYVDDIIITGNSSIKVNECIAALAHTFSIKDLGNLHYFLGVEVIPSTAGLFLSQHKYIGDLLERTKMQDAKPVLTPMSTTTPMCKDDGSPSTDTTFYRSTIGSLQYLSLTGLTLLSPSTSLLNSCRGPLRHILQH